MAVMAMSTAASVSAKVLQPSVGLLTTQRRGTVAESRKKKSRVIIRRAGLMSDGAVSDAAVMAAAFSSAQIASCGTRRAYYSCGSARLILFQAAAASDSSRRDRQRLTVARTQSSRRGARNVKGGGTPSKKPESVNNNNNNLEEGQENADYLLDDEDDVDSPLPEDEAAAIPVETAKASYVGDKWAAGRDEEAGFNRTQGVENLNEQVQQSAEDVAETTSEAVDDSTRSLRRTGRRLGKNLDESRKEGDSIVREGAEAINKQARRAGSDIREGVEEVGESAQKLAGLAQETAEESGKQIQEAGDEIRENIQEVGQEGEKLIRKGGEAAGEQAREIFDEVEKQAQRPAEATERSVRRISNRAETAADRVQAPIEKAVDASIKAAEAVGKEAFGVGQTVLETAEQATGMASTGMSNSRPNPRELQFSAEEEEEGDSEKLVGGRYKAAGKEVLRNKQGVAGATGQQQNATRQEIRDRKYTSAGKEVMRKFQGMGGSGEQQEQEEELHSSSQGKENADSYTGLKVLVAGASGRTGRLIVENLISKGVPVRALVRDVNKARRIKQLEKAELVVGDMCKYETLKQALADSNVVICANGARGFTLDLLQTYKTEYEGVVNLVSAAKNQGNVKKFVFITTIGVSILQIVPLLFWKRQAELFLQRSGLDYTIVRPGGLRNDSGMNENVQLRPADSQFIGAVSRRKVAEVCATALVTPESSEKVVEIVAGSGRGRREIEDQFATI